MRGGRDLDTSKMFRSKFDSDGINCVDEDATSQSDDDSVCAFYTLSSFLVLIPVFRT